MKKDSINKKCLKQASEVPNLNKPLTLGKLTSLVHDMSRSKGWYDTERTPLEFHMLMVSEIAEATEAARINMPPLYFLGKEDSSVVESAELTEVMSGLMKPEGEAVELVDCLIRILDYFGSQGWDVEEILKLKVAYNSSRSYRHGDKKC